MLWRTSAVLAGVLLCALAPAAQWQTSDGLGLELSEQTGRVTGVRVDGAALPLAAGVQGGLSFREFTRDSAAAATTVLRLTAEGDQVTWAPASFADWAATGDFVRRGTGGAAEGEAYLQIGDGKSPGVGLAATRRFPLTPGADCTISWQARTADTSLTYILCLRLFDAAGTDITEPSPASVGWTYSPFSKALYRTDLANAKAGTWEPLSCSYQVPEGAAAGQLSLRIYRGGTLQADVDDLQVVSRAGHWSEERPLVGPLTATAAGLRQQATEPSAGLACDTSYRVENGCLRATVTVSATGTPRDRCLQVRYRLPLALHGWVWSGDPRRDVPIAPGVTCEDAVGLAGHGLSRYPVASVSRGQVGLALAAPLDRPALQTFRATTEGLETVVDLALSPRQPAGRASFSFCLYRHAPDWTFRAALERYYALFPQYFAPATTRGGAWTLRVPPAELTPPADFALAFYECNLGLPQERRDYCRVSNILTLVYSEPWGRRQVFPQARTRAELPPYEERLAQLRQWAAEPNGQKWNGAPRAEVAQAVLNSLQLGADGTAAHLVDLYSTWAQWWQLSTDPSLPEPNIASVCRKYEIEPALQWADGIYLDSVSFTTGQFEDLTPGHLAAADLPLAFSYQSGQPTVLSAFAAAEYMAALREDLHRRGKLLMLNLFPPATRLYGHLGDIVGDEQGGLEDDVEAMQQRIYACRRPVSNLLQSRWSILQRVPALTPAELEDYLANQLLYGFWPGLSTIGGGTEPGYAHLHRYFEDKSLLDRDRPLFARYLPVFEALNRAGWQPVTHVRCATPDVRVERYGERAATLLAVANAASEPRQALLALDTAWWEQATGQRGRLRFRSELGGETVEAGETCQITIPARRTLVLSVAR